MLSKEFFDEWEISRQGTLLLAKEVPNDKLDWKPHPDMKSLGELNRHIAGSVYFMLNKMLIRDVKTPAQISENTSLNREVFIQELQNTDTLVKKVLSELEVADLTKKAFTDRSGNDKTVGWVLWHFKEHELHHRAQLKMYLKLLGQNTSALNL